MTSKGKAITTKQACHCTQKKKTVSESIGTKLRKENKKVLSFLASFESMFPFFSLWKYQKTLRVEKENIGSKLLV